MTHRLALASQLLAFGFGVDRYLLGQRDDIPAIPSAPVDRRALIVAQMYGVQLVPHQTAIVQMFVRENLTDA